jgi:hypothetical protein
VAAGLFLPEPQIELNNGLQTNVEKKEPINHWKELTRAIEEASAEGYNNIPPNAERQLSSIGPSSNIIGCGHG